jgi:hypothetical protein
MTHTFLYIQNVISDEQTLQMIYKTHLLGCGRGKTIMINTQHILEARGGAVG